MLTDAEPFLQRIRAFPDDDGPRLVFADWLEEQGGTALARAAFIRVQLALAAMAETDAARPELEAAERVLRDAHGAEWTAPFRGVSFLDFRRGFVDTVRIGAVPFLRHAHELFAASPVRHLDLMDAGPHLGAITASPYLGRLAGLTIEAQHLRDPLARASGHSHLAGLGPRPAPEPPHRRRREWLAGSPNLSGLESLILSENELTESGARGAGRVAAPRRAAAAST